MDTVWFVVPDLLQKSICSIWAPGSYGPRQKNVPRGPRGNTFVRFNGAHLKLITQAPCFSLPEENGKLMPLFFGTSFPQSMLLRCLPNLIILWNVFFLLACVVSVSVRTFSARNVERKHLNAIPSPRNDLYPCRQYRLGSLYYLIASIKPFAIYLFIRVLAAARRVFIRNSVVVWF